MQEAFLHRFHSIAFDDAVARVHGPLRAKLDQSDATVSTVNLLIASIAITNGLVLVTHNTKEFERIPGLFLQDWEIEDPKI